MPCSCEAPKPQPFAAGQKIHRKLKQGQSVRIGGAEIYRLVFIDERHVIASAYRKDGSFISEWHMLRDEFDTMYERCPGE